MDTFELKITKTMKLPTTVSDWQLFSSMAESCEAAQALTHALVRAIQVSCKLVAIRIMHDAMEKYSHCGATDTEPCAVAERFLTEARGESFSWEL